MDTPLDTQPDTNLPVLLDQHDNVRYHVCRRLSDEVARLEQRIDILQVANAPHSSIIIATYERLIERKKRFMTSWGMDPDKLY